MTYLLPIPRIKKGIEKELLTQFYKSEPDRNTYRTLDAIEMAKKAGILML